MGETIGGPLRIYIAGPYRASTASEVDANINRARDAMAQLLRMGHTPFCPHSMTARFERDYPDIPDDVYLTTDIEWLGCCDAVLRLPGWENSSGTRAELREAATMGHTIYTSIERVPMIDGNGGPDGGPAPPPGAAARRGQERGKSNGDGGGAARSSRSEERTR